MLLFSSSKLTSFFRLSASSVSHYVSQFCCWFKMRVSSISLTGLETSAVATNLYVSSYSGAITTLQLNRHADGTHALRSVAVNTGSAPSPSWLTLNEDKGVVYCLDEGLTSPNGSIASYTTSSSGDLRQIDRHSIISGPVSSVVYNGGKALAVAH